VTARIWRRRSSVAVFKPLQAPRVRERDDESNREEQHPDDRSDGVAGDAAAQTLARCLPFVIADATT
jgi:hypothetical protein